MRLHHLAIMVSSLALAACGGTADGGGGGGGGGVPNLPPDFGALELDLTVPENTAGVITTVTVSDEDTANIVLTLGGTDSGEFSIDAVGNLSFITPPDFENPTDNGADNVYEVTVIATDTIGNRSELDVTVTVTNIVDFVATRYLDPLFSDLSTIGDVQIASPNGGSFGVTLIGPANDLVTDRPLVLVASGGFFGAQQIAPEAIAQQFVQRGYVAGIVTRAGATSFLGNQSALAVESAFGARDIMAAAGHFRAQASQYGLDGATVLVAGEGAGGLIASLAVSMDRSDNFSNTALAARFTNGQTFLGSLGGNSSLQGAMSISGGLLDLGLVDARSGVLFATHRAGDARLGCNAGSCGTVRSFQSAGVPANLHLLNGSHTSFSAIETQVIFQGAANLFYTQVIQERSD